jgi:tetratricopeptide (TPR) repeat protein
MGMANRDFFTENTLHPRMFSLLLLSATFVLFSGCGGDSEEETQVSAEEVTVNESLSSEETLSDVPDEPVDQVISSPKEEQKEAPNPNGIFLPIFEDNGGKQVASQLNNKPAYSNGKGYFMWSNGSNWKITTKLGGGRVISTGGEKLLDPWSGGGKARHAPDEEYTKQAMFRLAVAYQGSEDNENAIRLYKQFVTLFPDDKMVAEAYLGLGDLAISGVSPDSQPTFEQITQARENYAMVREKTQQIGLISDSTFNEGGLIERVAENPEGLINYFFTFDKDENEVISKDEFAGIQAKFPDLSSFETYDLSTDGSLDFGELYDVAASNSYKNLEQIYQNYAEKFGSMEGAQIAQATEKIGFALEKQGKPSKMLSLYYEDIKKFGNDPSSVGVDAILKKYCDKYKEYEDLFGLTLDLLQKLQNPAEPVSFTFRNRKGIEEEISGTIEEIVKDRSKVLAFLSTEYNGMDPKIYSDIVKYRGAIFINPDYAAKFQGYLKKYKEFNDNFPSELAPQKAFARLLDDSVGSGQKTLELRMRANLDRVGSRAGGDYNPQSSDFPAASAGVLVWMAEKMLAQNSLGDAVSAMERLVELYGDSGGDFLFDAHYLIGKAKEKERDYLSAASHFESALTNSTWHPQANDARIRRGHAWFEVAEAEKDAESYQRSRSSFEEVRGDTEASLEMRAESAFMMGECMKAQKDYAGAAFLFLETTLNFPSALKWAPKSFEQAIRCYEQAGQADQVSMIEKQYTDWQRKFLK